MLDLFVGTYNGKVYSGEYGDMAATVAAILLEPEARSVMLDYDPTFGRLREPLLKVIWVGSRLPRCKLGALLCRIGACDGTRYQVSCANVI